MKLKRTLFLILACTGMLFFGKIAQADYTLPQHNDPEWQQIVNITWSTDNNTWGTNAVSVGDTVYFKFDVYKKYYGTHYGDVLKAWLSSDQSFQQTETIAYDFHKVFGSVHENQFPGDYVNSTYSVVSELTITNAMAGQTYWLLARITCTESLNNSDWAAQWGHDKNYYNDIFSPTTTYGQGNAMLKKFTVNPVPEPTTMLLFGTGIAGLAGVARRKRS